MSEDWKAGDLAMCVAQMILPNGQACPLLPGYVGTVHAVGPSLAYPGLLFIGFQEWSPFGFQATAFRKIAPHKPDCEDAITVRQLNGISKPGDKDLHLAPRQPKEAQR